MKVYIRLGILIFISVTLFFIFQNCNQQQPPKNKTLSTTEQILSVSPTLPPSGLTTDQPKCPEWAPPPPDFCSYGTLFPSMIEPSTNCVLPPKCIAQPTDCPQLSPPAPGWCTNGTIFPPISNNSGCLSAPRCLLIPNNCPQMSPPDPDWCKDELIIYLEPDNNECPSTPLCNQPKVTCPKWIAPHPDWCSKGTLIQSRFDSESGCYLPPQCQR